MQDTTIRVNLIELQNMMHITLSLSCRPGHRTSGLKNKVWDRTFFRDRTNKVYKSMLTIGLVTIGLGSNTWLTRSKIFTSISSLDCHSWDVIFVVLMVMPLLTSAQDGIKWVHCSRSLVTTTKMQRQVKNHTDLIGHWTQIILTTRIWHTLI